MTVRNWENVEVNNYWQQMEEGGLQQHTVSQAEWAANRHPAHVVYTSPLQDHVPLTDNKIELQH